MSRFLNFTGTSTVRIENYYHETMEMDNGDSLEFFVDLETGVLTSMSYQFSNSSSFRFWSIDRTRFSEYMPPSDTSGDSNYLIYIGAGATGVILVVVGIQRRRRRT